MLSITQLNAKSKQSLESLGNLEIFGEISRITKHASGHWYFTLKDESSSIACAMYKTYNYNVNFNPKEGMSIKLQGKLSIYSPSGSYQFLANKMTPNGEGMLELAFLELKQRLDQEGLFVKNSPIKKFPKKIAIIGSKTSAALADMLKIASNKIPFEICIFDSLTQGENAPRSLISSLKKADKFNFDLIIIARGGGSKEDLWCFNDENLARVIFECKTPIISAIGHEIDYVISDFVADYRAPTPSAAMGLFPDKNQILNLIDDMLLDFDMQIKNKIVNAQNDLNALKNNFSSGLVNFMINLRQNELNSLRNFLKDNIKNKIHILELKLKNLNSSYDMQKDFFNKTKLLVNIKQNGKIINLKNLNLGDEFELVSQDDIKKARILE